MPARNIFGERFQLLNTFKAIYDNGGISTAARSLGMTQSAVSKHLNKLRDWFGDDLFVRTARGMEPTAKATAIIEDVARVLNEVSALGNKTAFNPEQHSGVFTIATTSEICHQLAAPLLQILQKSAPQLRLTLINLQDDYAIRELETGKVNLVISVNWHAPDALMQQRLFSDRFVCVMNKSHALAKKKLTLENYIDLPHVLVAPLGHRKGFIDHYIEANNLYRHVRLSVPDFSQLDTTLIDERHIVTVPHRIAIGLRNRLPVVVKPLPLEVPGFDYYMFWHKRFTQDQAHQWMRDNIRSVIN